MSASGPLAAVALVGAVLAAGGAAVAVLHRVVGALVGGDGLSRAALADPWRRAALLLVQQRIATERPDATGWLLAPVSYLAFAAAALAVVPVGAGLVAADFPAGVVLYGAAETGAMVAVFLAGWSPNAPFPLVAGYRFLVLALSYVLLSMFVLIAAALPAESLAFSDVVRAQTEVWNAVRHPLSLPLWLVVALGVAFWGPLDYVQGRDLSGGAVADASGSQRLVWQVGRVAMLVAAAAVGTTAFLGGWTGPLLPGPVWFGLKTLVLLGVLVALGHVVARPRLETFVRVAWTVLLPLAFVDLAIAGVLAL